MKQAFSAFVLGAFLFTPAVIQASPDDHKYYDREHKDYHAWNNGEDAAWHRYLSEKHMKEHDWTKAKKREQQAYWHWRHDHPDTH